MKTLAELSAILNENVVAAMNHDSVCYHLLIQTQAGKFYKSYWVEGQKMGITLIGTRSSGGKLGYSRMPKFINNCAK